MLSSSESNRLSETIANINRIKLRDRLVDLTAIALRCSLEVEAIRLDKKNDPEDEVEDHKLQEEDILFFLSYSCREDDSREDVHVAVSHTTFLGASKRLEKGTPSTSALRLTHTCNSSRLLHHCQDSLSMSSFGGVVEGSRLLRSSFFFLNYGACSLSILRIIW